MTIKKVVYGAAAAAMMAGLTATAVVVPAELRAWTPEVRQDMVELEDGVHPYREGAARFIVTDIRRPGGSEVMPGSEPVPAAKDTPRTAPATH